MVAKTLDSSVLLTRQTKLPIQITIRLQMIDPSAIELSALPSVPFGKPSELPAMAGIYLAIDSNNVVQYVGKSTNIRSRWTNHNRKKDVRNAGVARISYILVDDSSFLDEIERALIRWFNPPLNGTFTGRQLRSPIQKIVALRERAGLTQVDVANLLNVRQASVSDWERGVTVLHLPADKFFALVDAYQCTVEEMVEAFEGDTPASPPILPPSCYKKLLDTGLPKVAIIEIFS